MKDRIIKIRKALDLNQAQFAEKLGVSRSFICVFEAGDRNISDRTIADICRIFGANEEWIRTGEGEMFLPKTREDQIADLVKTIYTDDDPFRMELIKILCEMSDDQIATMKQIVIRLAEACKEKDLPD